MLRPVAALVSGVVAVVLAGCGTQQKRVTRSEAVAFARAVNLSPSDVPGMHSYSAQAQAAGSVVRFQLTPRPGCGAPDQSERFDVYSPVFSTSHGDPQPLPAEGLHSRVAVMHTADEQGRDFAAQQCDERSSGPPSGTTRTPLQLPGIPVVGVRSRGPAPSYMFRAANVTLYRDRFSFVAGPAEVVLSVSSAPRPPSAGLERRLVSLLYERAHQVQPVFAGKRVLIIR